MPDLMPFDELNRFEERLPDHFETDPDTGKRRIKSKQDYEDILDEMFDLFMMSYATGTAATNIDLGSDVTHDVDTVIATIDAEVAGQTWRQRVRKYYEDGGDEADVMRIATTESHRDSNAAAYNTAKKAGAVTKVWHCMLLPTSRDSHVWLDGVTAPIDGAFYNYKGESTFYPGQWGIAEEDVNCLCWLTYA